jgi:hypothetical protein
MQRWNALYEYNNAGLLCTGLYYYLRILLSQFYICLSHKPTSRVFRTLSITGWTAPLNRFVDCCEFTDVSGARTASINRPWRWRRQVLQKRSTTITLHGVSTQKTVVNFGQCDRYLFFLFPHHAYTHVCLVYWTYFVIDYFFVRSDDCVPNLVFTNAQLCAYTVDESCSVYKMPREAASAGPGC